jgi:hypothetical protein
LEHLQANGPTSHAFTFKMRFEAPDKITEKVNN